MSREEEEEVSSGCSHPPCPAPPQLKLYQTVIFATPVLFASVILLLFCLLCLRRRRHRHRWPPSARLLSPSATAAAVPSFPALPNHQYGNAVAVPLPPPLSNGGLTNSFRQSLQPIAFDDKLAARGDTQCAVCLGDYLVNEKLLQLPSCAHVFHLECVDKWLCSNITCPICRASLTSQSCSANKTLTSPAVGRSWEERVVSGDQVSLHELSFNSSSAEAGGGSVDLIVSRLSNEQLGINIERS